MLYLIAPEIHYQKRYSWLEDLFNKEDFDSLIIESNIGEREAKKTGFNKEILLYNEHTNPQEEKSLLEKLKTNKAALLSDGGFPFLGDPGSTLVRLCHQNNINIQTRGIHSYLMAALLMSGCNANQFKFIGYPPVSDQTERKNWLKKQTQSFPNTSVIMEPPYRTRKLLEELIDLLPLKAWLSFSTQIGQAEEKTYAFHIKTWKENKQKLFSQIDKKPLGVICVEV